MAGTNEFAFFRCKSICTGGGSRIRPKKIRKNAFRPVPVQKFTFPVSDFFLWGDPSFRTPRRTAAPEGCVSPSENSRRLWLTVAARHSLLVPKFSGKECRRCWKILHRFSGSTKCYACQGLGIFRQGKWLLINFGRFCRNAAGFSPLRPPQPS